jgi:hypothetical protein
MLSSAAVNLISFTIKQQWQDKFDINHNIKNLVKHTRVCAHYCWYLPVAFSLKKIVEHTLNIDYYQS